MNFNPNNLAKGDALPPELQDLVEEMKAAKAVKIAEIGRTVGKKRDEAVKGRKASGIETIWEEDECYYEGVDDANRESHPWLKSASNTGGISRTPSTTTTRCTSFFNITRQFVESASARMGDILLPAGDWNFAIKATPVQDAGQNMAEAFAQTATVADDAQKQADIKAEKAELKIQDWLIECSYHTEVRKVIEDSAKLGTGILKGPYPNKYKQCKATESQEGMTVELASTTGPKSSYVSVWDFFPDPACGDDIHSGNYVFERDRLTSRQLKDLKGIRGYLPEQIDKILDEGPNKKNYSDDGHRPQTTENTEDDKFEVWYFYGLLDVVALSAMDVKISDSDAKKDMIPAIVALVNETPIKAHINPLDTGEFPYDLMPWQRMAGTPWGIGVARQGRTAQDMLNAAARNMMDNAGLSAKPMIIMRQNAIRPADGVWTMTSGKVWIASEQADIRSVQDAIMAINIPMMQAELQAIIQLAYKMMEDATGIMYLLQGQQGSAPDTVGGMELLHRNASAILRRLARVFDERVTERHVRRYYEWLLMYGPDDCKGDMKIQAIGSTALVEREIQTMQSMQLLTMSLNPAFGLDPEKAMVEVLKAQRFVPDKWTMDETKKGNQQPAVIPAIEVAKIRAAQEDKKLVLEKDVAISANMLQKHKIEVDTDRDVIYNQTMADRDRTTAQARMDELLIKKELAMLEYASKRNISLDQIKADLAKEGMRLKTQKELAFAAREPHIPAHPQVAPTSMEPVGRADSGHAFEE